MSIATKDGITAGLGRGAPGLERPERKTSGAAFDISIEIAYADHTGQGA
jgi:hypothetical protein